MDPNTNQPTGTNPTVPPIPQPAAPEAAVTPPAQPTPATPVAPAPVGETPKKGGKKWLILLLILLLLAVGIIAYVLFAKNQMNKAQKETTENTSTVLPTPTLVPTLAPEEDLEVASPEADLLDIELDVKGL